MRRAIAECVRRTHARPWTWIQFPRVSHSPSPTHHTPPSSLSLVLFLLLLSSHPRLHFSSSSTQRSNLVSFFSSRVIEIRRAIMVSEASTPSSSDQEAADTAVEKSVNRCSSTKSKPKKIAKKVHKSEREKLKRDQLNILFLQLSKCLDSVHQNHGKASTLTEATKLVGDLISQIECLKKENTSLLSESQYLIIEKNELKEENGALKDEIMEVQNKIGEKIHSHSSDSSAQLVEENMFVKLSHQSQLVVIPSSSLQQQQVETYREECSVVAPPPSSNHVIRRPHARYPSPWDSWPSQILDNQTNIVGGGG